MPLRGGQYARESDEVQRPKDVGERGVKGFEGRNALHECQEFARSDAVCGRAYVGFEVGAQCGGQAVVRLLYGLAVAQVEVRQRG